MKRKRDALGSKSYIYSRHAIETRDTLGISMVYISYQIENFDVKVDVSVYDSILNFSRRQENNVYISS